MQEDIRGESLPSFSRQEYLVLDGGKVRKWYFEASQVQILSQMNKEKEGVGLIVFEMSWNKGERAISSFSLWNSHFFAWKWYLIPGRGQRMDSKRTDLFAKLLLLFSEQKGCI